MSWVENLNSPHWRHGWTYPDTVACFIGALDKTVARALTMLHRKNNHVLNILLANKKYIYDTTCIHDGMALVENLRQVGPCNWFESALSTLPWSAPSLPTHQPQLTMANTMWKIDVYVLITRISFTRLHLSAGTMRNNQIRKLWGITNTLIWNAFDIVALEQVMYFWAE